MASSSLRAALGLGATVLAACGGDTSRAATDPGGRDGGVTTNPDGGTPDATTAGCGIAGVKKGFVGSQSIAVGGVQRTYQLYVPDSYDGHTTYPLAFVFHGDGEDGASIRADFNLEAESAGGAIFVYPDGLGQTWTIDQAVGLKADIAFVDAVAVDLGASHCVDSKRLFAVGFSRGAYFTNMLACLSKTNLRAVVTHSGGGPFGLDGSGTAFDASGDVICPAPPVAALQVHATSDVAVPLSEGIKARDYWRRVNGCIGTSKAYDPSPCVAYNGCAPERPEVWCEIPGTDHAIWPQNGAKVTWAFLKTK